MMSTLMQILLKLPLTIWPIFSTIQMTTPNNAYEDFDLTFITEEENSKNVQKKIQEIANLPLEEFMMQIALPPPKEPVLFDVDPQKYPMQPWLKAMMNLKYAKTPEQVQFAKQNLRQWFNHDLNPETFVAYAKQQQQVRSQLEEIQNQKFMQQNKKTF